MSKKETDAQIIRRFNKEYWKDFFPKCKECRGDCKQSWRLLELRCGKFWASPQS